MFEEAGIVVLLLNLRVYDACKMNVAPCMEYEDHRVQLDPTGKIHSQKCGAGGVGGFHGKKSVPQSRNEISKFLFRQLRDVNVVRMVAIYFAIGRVGFQE